MSNAALLRNASEIAKGLNDPRRWAEALSYYHAMNSALTKTHIQGEQDGLALFEAFGMALGQIIAGLPEDERKGFLAYVTARAQTYVPQFLETGKAAQHTITLG